MTHAHICSLSVGIDELPHKAQRDDIAVASVLAKQGRFSIFEATANSTIANTMTRIANSGWFVFDHATGYPWTQVTITELGRTVLETGVIPDAPPRPVAVEPALVPGPPPKQRTMHRASMVSARGVSALCFRRPRAIDMEKASWTTTDAFVTCPKCLKLIAGKET